MARAEVRLYKRKAGGAIWSLWMLLPDSDWILLGFGANSCAERAEADAHRRAATVTMALVRLVDGKQD